ncbi:UDP-N-acetylglucosamine diphosphorylase [Cerasicoccus fimbriatus]|uniref:acyltransferase n=1 Tax=Cerasicoccus fimbriatus TaxID=3014554 RepID=UPI0022B3618E|nr:UDP-N-acetylglucosamine diphosphorylase [Cerasicoccus sp. TK19100]
MIASDVITLPETLEHFAKWFSPDDAPWAWIPRIEEALSKFSWLLAQGHSAIPAGMHIKGKVYIHPTVKLPPTAVIEGPTWIGPGTEIRPNAYIRGKVIIGANCVIGNSCELKNCLVLDGAQVPHFNYVGDSVLGQGAHLGAGVILANLRLDQASVPVRLPSGTVDSGLRKFGAIFGDHAEAGCNAVIQPGTILGRKAIVMPSMSFGGYLPDGKMVYAKTETRIIDRRF